jgi:hypothetical protein
MAITPLPDPPSRADPSSFSDRADDFLGALPLFAEQVNDIAAQMFAAAVTAINAPGTIATSTTSLAIGNGSKTLIVQTGKQFAVGQYVMIARTTAPSNYLHGQVTAYDTATGALAVAVTATGGTGTYTGWTVSLSLPQIALPLSGNAEVTGPVSFKGAARFSSTAFMAATEDIPAFALEHTGVRTWSLGGYGLGTAFGFKDDAHAYPALGIDSNYDTFVNQTLTVVRGIIAQSGIVVGAAPGPVGAINFANGSRIFSPSANAICLSANLVSESVRIQPAGTVNVHGQRGTAGDIQGSGNLRVIAAGAGAIAISTYDTQDYTAFQVTRQSGVDTVQVGAIVAGATATSYNTSSDERLKENFRDFDAGQLIDDLWVGEFDWKSDGSVGHGVRAQQAEKVYPQAITAGAAGGPWAADYSKFVPLLLREVQRLRQRVAALESAALPAQLGAAA